MCRQEYLGLIFFRSVGFAYCSLITFVLNVLNCPIFDVWGLGICIGSISVSGLLVVNELTSIIKFLPKLYVIK